MICPSCGEEVKGFASHLRGSEPCREVLNGSLSSRFRVSYEPSSNTDPDIEVTNP